MPLKQRICLGGRIVPAHAKQLLYALPGKPVFSLSVRSVLQQGLACIMFPHSGHRRRAPVWRRLQAELQSAQARAEEVERSVQAQLASALNRLSALEAEPPAALVERLADVQASAKGVSERCERLEQELAAAHR